MAEQREEQERLARALASLPEEARSALLLRESEGLSFAEVGALLGRSEVWARVTCFRARQRVRQHYLNQLGGINRDA